MSAGGWITYCLAVGALMTTAAWLVDRGIVRLRLPVRWVWVAALVLSVGLPVREALVGGTRGIGRAATESMPPTVLPAEAGSDVPRLAVADFVSESAVAVVGGLNRAIARGSRAIALDAGIERWLLALWIAGSGATAVVLLIGRGRLHRSVRRWPVAQPLGTRVRVSEDFGPATVGVRGPEIVIPRWCLALPETELRLILDHEASHAEKADPLLLAAAALPVVLFFWNPFLWWQMARLRAAAEIDCDRRVLERTDSPAKYAQLLVRLGGGRKTTGPALAMAGSHSLLKRRILAMHARPLFQALPGSGAMAAAALMLVSVACSAQVPDRLPADQPTEIDPAMRAQLLADSIDAERRERGEFERIRESRENRILVRVDTAGPSYAIAMPAGRYTLDPNGLRIAIDAELIAPEFGARLSALAGLSPNDVVSIGLIGPPESVERYGPDGAGGVIEITTIRN